ncbi:hypothetical protein [Microbulbifer pacificus]|uniref:Uncharacterized protein n=1 Tax=Microbulbifer pacificus TaxID=407164 RepID=A0AAU0N4D2_9GAMM|nr:hypothetical protein [Microbulbifer pacificus]WOX06788.1 hypothetical protein R5R33_06575 [Microbulbifer pacificus]
MFSTAPARANTLIAGNHAGKRVTITPQAELIWRELVKLANTGNYWALLTVRGIEQLAAGRLSRKDIFVNPGSIHRGGNEEFVVILPGCRVTAEKLADDSYQLLHFQADLGYGQLIKEGKAPGLYEVRKNRNIWQSKPRSYGTLKNEKHRVLAVSDSGYDTLDVAANSVAPNLSGGAVSEVSGGGVTLDTNGFDMHFTPGEARIGGLKNYRKAINPLKDENLHESALLLARTIYMARKVQDVRIISEFGGSAVLTQALRILADRKVTLEDHTVFLVRPTTSPHEAIKAAHGVMGLKLQRNFNETGMLDYIGNRDQLELIQARRRHEHKSYTYLHAATDVVLTGKSLQGAIGFIAGAAALVGLSISAPATGAFLAALGAAAGKVAAASKLGDIAMQAWLPRQYNKLKGKF